MSLSMICFRLSFCELVAAFISGIGSREKINVPKNNNIKISSFMIERSILFS